MKLNEMYDRVMPDDLQNELRRLCLHLETAQGQLKTASLYYAKKESAYRKAKALAYLSVDGTVEARKAKVDEKCGDERQTAYLARAAREAALENVKSIRAQLSALQSIAASVRSEMELASAPQPRWSQQ
jgi:hypothetical protein